MTLHTTTQERQDATSTELLRLEMAGRQSARSVRVLHDDAQEWRGLDHRAHGLRTRVDALLSQHQMHETHRRWLNENYRLLRTALRECRDIGRSLRHHPAVLDERGTRMPRAYQIAHDYLNAAIDSFSEEGLTAFLRGYQSILEVEMGELWALRPALQFVLLERVLEGPREKLPAFLVSLRRTGEAQWKDLFEAVSIVDRILADAPGSEYSRMDYESRDLYRKAISDISKHSPRSERETAEKAIELASLGAGRRACIGYYLIDRGADQLRDALGHRRPFMERVRRTLFTYPEGFYLVGIEVATLAIVYALLSPLGSLTPIVAAFFLLLLPVTQAAVDFMNQLVSFLIPPRVLPKLDFSKGIPADCASMIAVPTLLMNESQVRDLALDLEIRYLANRDPNLYFALLTDSPDSDEPRDGRDALVSLCAELIRGLNRRYGSADHTPFYMFHRYRVFNPSEGRWMGWERKRGKLVDLNQLLRGGFDAFPVKIGRMEVLPKIRYVITLDSDTQLPRDAAAKLAGTMAHPLNRAVIHPLTRTVVEGYGILQPRVGVSIQSAARSRLASIYSGQTGFDIYTRAISDVYQDLFGEGIFTGKGIYDVDALHETLGQRFPDNALLSHDLIEGSYARAGLVSDIELIDDYPSHFSAYSRRKHRWVRGDWQIMRWILPRVPDFHGNIVFNPINLISRWKIVDNLRRSLFEPATLLLLIAGWFYLPGSVWHWTGASVAMWLMPVYAGLLFSLPRAPWGRRTMKGWARDLAKSVWNGHIIAILGIVFLLHQALLSLDAIVRSVLRVFVTGRKMLEWETAAEAESTSRRKATVDIYLEHTPWIAAAIGIALWYVRPSSLNAAWPILTLWFAARWISGWLNRAPHTQNRELNKQDTELLNDSAEKIFRFFEEWNTEANHFLIPDNIREDGAEALRLSPTNVGFLLNAYVAEVVMGKSSVAVFAAKSRRTLDTVIALPKHRGHLLNWYDISTLRPLEPAFVSTVDSGNLVACLWTLKQAALSFIEDHHALADQLQQIASDCEQLVEDMEFGFLYHPRKKVLSVGFDVTNDLLESSSYDLIASESRIASFVAIAKGDIPQEAWFHLGRKHTLVRGERVLMSWTGTMFEYLMPALWMRHYPGTILQDTLNSLIRVQREYGRKRGVPWGISESACTTEGGCEYGYEAFGIPDLAMKQHEADYLVVSPYSTFLALTVEPKLAMKNLQAMQEFGWTGRYGFYEAVDYTRSGGEIVRSWMAHHQGMSLLAICNVLFDSPMQKFFHSEPRVLATELLLHERVPSAIVVDAEELPAVAVA